MNAAALQAAQKAKSKAAKGVGSPRVERSHVFLARSPDTVALKGKSGTTAAGRLSTAGEKQEQDKAAGYVLRTGPSGGLDFRREVTRRALLDRLGRSSNAYRTEDPFDGGESGVPAGFGSAEDQIHSEDDPMIWTSSI